MIKKLSIEQYKGFYEKQELLFASPILGKPGSGLTLIVGPNNTGKTTIIEALLLNEQKKFKESERHHNLHPKITIESETGTITYTNVDDGSQIKPEIANASHGIKFELIPSRRYWNTYSGGEWDFNQLISTSTGQEVRNSSGIETAAALKSINRDTQKKQLFNEYIKKVIAHFTDWTIDTNDQGDYVKYMTSTTSHQTNLLGDGVISIFRICAHLVADAKDHVLIIDEPELSLHPTAQKALSRIIAIASQNRQIVLCTHSPHFANWSDLANGAKFIRLNKPNDEKCIISSLDTEAKYSQFIMQNYKEYQKPQLLDYVSKEILFSEKILFVEGQEDVGLIKKWFAENDIEPNFEIFGYGVASWSNIKLFLKLAKDLGIDKAAALYDHGTDTKLAYESAIKEFPTYFITILPTDDIRDKPDKEGCFSNSGVLKAERKTDFQKIMQSIIDYFQ